MLSCAGMVAGSTDAVLGEAVVELAFAHPEHFGGELAVVSAAPEGLDDQFPFEFVDVEARALGQPFVRALGMAGVGRGTVDGPESCDGRLDQDVAGPGAVEGVLEGCEGDGLGEKIDDVAVDGASSEVEGAVAGGDDDGDGRVTLPDFLEQVEAELVPEPEVEYYDGEALGGEHREGFAGGGGALGLEVHRLERFSVHELLGGVVLDDEDAARRNAHGWNSRAGMAMMNVLPFPGPSLNARRAAPIDAASVWAMERPSPSPLPCSLSDWNGVKSC